MWGIGCTLLQVVHSPGAKKLSTLSSQYNPQSQTLNPGPSTEAMEPCQIWTKCRSGKCPCTSNPSVSSPKLDGPFCEARCMVQYWMLVGSVRRWAGGGPRAALPSSPFASF